jgi:hypothetical protein
MFDRNLKALAMAHLMSFLSSKFAASTIDGSDIIPVNPGW